VAISSPELFRARTGIELRTIEADGAVTPYAGHEFERTDRAVIRFFVTGTGASLATIKARLLNRSATALVDLPVTQKRPGEYEVSLTIASIARGEYLVEITAVTGEARVQALAPLRVR
jgi:hypothetical protein